jgi:hypothetical protein
LELLPEEEAAAEVEDDDEVVFLEEEEDISSNFLLVPTFGSETEVEELVREPRGLRSGAAAMRTATATFPVFVFSLSIAIVGLLLTEVAETLAAPTGRRLLDVVVPDRCITDYSQIKIRNC